MVAAPIHVSGRQVGRGGGGGEGGGGDGGGGDGGGNWNMSLAITRLFAVSDSHIVTHIAVDEIGWPIVFALGISASGCDVRGSLQCP